jgi:hypothetical protein
MPGDSVTAVIVPLASHIAPRIHDTHRGSNLVPQEQHHVNCAKMRSLCRISEVQWYQVPVVEDRVRAKLDSLLVGCYLI